jgi:YHS domain-containing protein
VYFCCPACIGKFKKDPAKHIKRLEAAGVTFDKLPGK